MDIVDVYKRTGNFTQTVKVTGLNPIGLHIELIKKGLLDFDDEVDYSLDPYRLGMIAEKEFHSLVPEAIDVNRTIRKNNPGYDFDYRGLTIDVKYSSKLKRDLREYYSFGIGAFRPDVYVVFCERESNQMMYRPYIWAIPGRFVKSKKSLQVTLKTYLFYNFQVNEKDLKKVLNAYAELKKQKNAFTAENTVKTVSVIKGDLEKTMPTSKYFDPWQLCK